MTEEVTSIGIGLDTSGVQAGIRALDVLATKGAPVEKAMAGVEGAAERAGKSLKTLGESAGKGLGDVAQKAPAAADGLKKVDTSAEKAEKSVRSLGGAGASGLDALGKAAASTSAGMRTVGTASAAADKGIRGMATAANDVTAALRAEAAALTGLQSGFASVTSANAAAAKSMEEFRRSVAASTAAVEALVAKANGLDKLDQAGGKAATGVKGLKVASEGATQSMLALAGAGATAFIGSALVRGVAETTKAIYEASAAAQRFQTTLNFATGGRGAQEIAYLREVTKELGLQFNSTAQAYASFQAAAKGTTLEGQKAREVFESIAKASAVMGLSADQTSGVLLALQQMISKGTVQAEELRGQLGERLPGAFQIAAKAMGVTTGELGKMLERGEVVASDFLPKFARAMNEYLGDASEAASKRLDASVNRVETSFNRLKQNAGDSGISKFVAGQYEILADGLDGVSTSMEKARAQGSGFFGQLVAGSVAVLKFVNPLQAFSYSAVETSNALKQAEEEMKKLQATGAKDSPNFYIRNSYFQLQEYIKELKVAKAEQDKLTGATTGAGGGRGTVNPPTVAQNQERIEGIQAAMSKVLGTQAGVKDNFFKDLGALYAGFQEKLFSKDDAKNLKAYQEAVAKLIKDSATAKPDAGAGAALSDSLNAQVQLYKNRDQAILDGRKAFNDQIDLLVKLGSKSELDALQETLDKETETWKARKANFEEELAAASKKKNSQAEQSRIQGQLLDAEREHQQTVAKLSAESALLDRKSLDALDARISKEQAAARNGAEQLRLAKLEAQAIGLTGDALGKLRRAEVEYQATQLKSLALWADAVDATGALGRAYRQQAEDMLAAFDTRAATQSAAQVEEYSRSVNDAGKALEYELSVMGLSERERATAIEQRRIENELIKRRKEIEAATVNNPGERTRQLSDLEAAGIKDKANAENKAFLAEWEKTVGKYDDIFRQGFADMVNSGKSGWEAFTKSLATTFKTSVADEIYKQFLRPLVVNVVGSFMGMTGAGSAAAGQAGGLGGGGGIGGLINAGSTLYSALTNGISTSIAAGFAKFATSGVGTSLGLSTPAVVGNNYSAYVAPQMTPLGNTIGTGLGMLGSGLAGFGLSSLISGGYSVGGGNTVNILSGIASAFLGPIAGLAGGLLNRAFGRKLKDVGIEGTLGGSAGFTGEQYQFYEGGWFRSDKTTRSALDADAQKTIADSFKGIQAQVGTFATVLGLNTDKIAGFTTQLKFSTQGLSETEIQEKFAEALRTGSNELAQEVLGTWTRTSEEVSRTIVQNVGGDVGDISITTVTETITSASYAASEFAKDGEEAIDTLTRLATSFTTVNEVADALGYGLQDASLSVAAFASNVVEKFGGLEQFSQQMGQYLSNYYTEEEQRDALARRSSRALQGVGLNISAEQIVDATRPQVRAFVEMVLQEFGADSTQYATAVQQANALAGIYDPLPSVLKPAVEAAKEFEQTVDELTQKFKSGMQSLRGERDSLAVDLLRAGGDESGANALRRQQFLDSFVDDAGNKLDAARRQELATLYDLNEATRTQIATLDERNGLQDELNALTDTAAQALARQRDALDESNRALFDNIQAIKLQQTIAAELPGVAGAYLNPQQRLNAGYEDVARDLRAEGFADVTAQALERLSKGELAGLLTSVYNLGETSDSTRLVLLRAASALASLKDQAIDIAASRTDQALARAEAAASKQMEIYDKSIADVKKVIDAAKNGARELFGEVDAVAKFQGQQGRDFITQAIAQVRMGGALPDGQDLSDAISAVSKDIAATQYATQADADFQRLVVANELKALQESGGDQLTTQEAQLQALKDSVQWAREQVDALRGIDNKVRDLPSAIAELIMTYNTEAYLRNGGRPATQLGTGGAAYDTRTGVGHTSSGAYFDADVIGQAARDVLAANPDGSGAKTVYDTLKGSGFTLAEANEIFKLPAGTLEDEARKLGLPVFHTGTPYVPETGYALLQQGEAVIPAAYNPWANGSMGNSDQAVVAELRAARAELVEMRRQLDTLNYQTKRGADAANGQGEAPALVTTV